MIIIRIKPYLGIMNYRIKEGLSISYPERSVLFESFDTDYGDGYIFYNKICCVYLKRSHIYQNIEPYYFERILKNFRRSEYELNKQEKQCKKNNITLCSYEEIYEEIYEDKKDSLPDSLILSSEKHSMSKAILNIIRELPPIQQKIIKGIYFEDKKQKDLAKELGCTQGYISMQKKEALNKIEKYFLDNIDKERD